LAVDELLVAKFRNAGQACIAANRVYVHAGVADAFIQRLRERVSALRVGDGLTSPDIGPLINQAAVEKLQRNIEDAVVKGAHVVLGGDAIHGGGYFFAPTVLTDVREDMRIFQEENFGPVVRVTLFTDDDDVLERANDTASGLGAYIFTESHRK